MNLPVFASAPNVTPASGHVLLYLLVAGACLFAALHYLRRIAIIIGPWARMVTAATMVALSIGGALVALAAIAIGGSLT
jgi:hypothetical protein